MSRLSHQHAQKTSEFRLAVLRGRWLTMGFEIGLGWFFSFDGCPVNRFMSPKGGRADRIYHFGLRFIQPR